jgi:SOS-response transcriptional repressor LexA
VTERQLEILSAVDAQTRLRGYSPTCRELGPTIGLRSTNSVHENVRRLQRDGFLQPGPRHRRARNLALTAAGHEVLAKRRFVFFAVGRGETDAIARVAQ